MPIVMTTSKLKPGTLDEFQESLHNAVSIIFPTQPAWRATKFVVNHETNTAQLVSDWESVEAYKALVSTAEYMEAMASMSHYLTTPPVVTFYDVRFEFP
jgi:heme-degrading monooxygenase HmoA